MSLHRAAANSGRFSDDSPMRSFGDIGLKRISRNQKNELFDKNLFTNSVLKDKKRGFDLWSAEESIALNRETGATQRFAGGLSMLGQAAGAFGGARMDAAADEARWDRFKGIFGGGSNSGSFGTSLSGGEIRDLELSTGANSSNGFYLPQAWN
tara:strand:+ start:31 stop:489 length:459 start_codon:yes stop_codon:yes gene_type:complete